MTFSAFDKKMMNLAIQEALISISKNEVPIGSVLTKNNKGKSIVKRLFEKINLNPRRFISTEQLSNDKYRAISDFISGMTDRYAINLHKNFK